MVYDIVDEQRHGPSPDWGLRHSQARRRKTPGQIRLGIGYLLIPVVDGISWATQDVRQLLRRQ